MPNTEEEDLKLELRKFANGNSWWVEPRTKKMCNAILDFLEAEADQDKRDGRKSLRTFTFKQIAEGTGLRESSVSVACKSLATDLDKFIQIKGSGRRLAKSPFRRENRVKLRL